MTLSFNQQTGLSVTMTAMEKLWAFHGDIDIKPEHVKNAWLGMPASAWNEWRIPGSFVPGLIKAGTYYTPRGHEFWYVTKKKCHVVTVELEGYKTYDRLVLGFEDPQSISSSGLTLGAAPTGFKVV